MIGLAVAVMTLALLAAVILLASRDPRVPRLLPLRPGPDVVPTARHRRQDAQTGYLDATELRRRLDTSATSDVDLPRVPSRGRTLGS